MAKINYGAIAIVGVVSFVIVDTAARNRTSNSYRSYGSSFEAIEKLVTTDTTPKAPDTLKFPIRDRRGTGVTDPVKNTIDLKDPSNITKTVEYDPVTKQYTVKEMIGSQYYRQPTVMSFGEFYKMQSAQSEEAYWQKRASTISNLNQKSAAPVLNSGGKAFDRIFGGTKVDLRPQGSLGLTFGYQGQNIKNPVLVERARKNGGFDFDMDINMNLVGRIGDKLKLTTNYNTQSTFDFENQIKLEYTGYDDEIIKKIEAGNVSFPLRTSLISGVQSLFGVKTQLQFGRLTVTSVLSNQKSQKQNLQLRGGAQTSDFAITADQYEDNRHFLLAQFFRDTFNYSMSNLPVIRSLANVTRIEVWVTNKTGATTETRDIVGLMDMAEYKPYNTGINVLTNSKVPDRGTNDLYSKLTADPASRYTGTVVSRLLAMGLQPVQDFEKTFARKLDSTQFTINRQLGFISLNQQLQPDEVLAVAYEYTYNGRVYRVGEFSQDVPPDQNNSANQRILFLKLLKATSARPTLPIWDLMMKNIYATGAYQLNRQDFKLDVLYKDPGSEDRQPSDKRYIPDARGSYEGMPIISILNLDRLNNQNDPQPDGIFDYVEGYTINSQNGRIMFPMLEPFAQGVQKAFGGNAALEKKYMYRELYDSIKVVAQQFPQLNRYVMRGSYKSSNSSEIMLGGYNIPPGSVTVTAGGQLLRENYDYVIDYNMGRLKIINSGILSSGVPINVQFENNANFGMQVRNYLGTRFDYFVNDKLSIGSTIVRMSERPYYQKVNYGDDPIKNTVVGLDVNYNSDWKGLTRFLDKLPNYKTETPSIINFTGEVARLFPGHSKLVNAAGSKQGQVYIDDFEGARNGYDLKFPSTSWSLASTPKDAADEAGNILFPEADATNDLSYGKNRALLAWYIIEPTLQIPKSPSLPPNITADEQSDPRVRLVYQKDVFPNRSTDFGQSQLSTLDLAFYPTERGPYNFDASDSVTANGRLRFPTKRWGGIMRAIDNSDFETANIEFIEFWVQDPFIMNRNSKGGDLYFNLGNVSEDVLKDSRKFFENGLPDPNKDPNKIDTSNWGRIPKFQQQITQAFDNDPAIRKYQDVGFDGLNSQDEVSYRSNYINQLVSRFGAGSPIVREAMKDPSNDDYHFYRGADYDAEKKSILERYKRINGPEGNSPVSDNNSQFSSAATNYPESEDLNRDNTMNESEEYFQYRVKLTPDMQVGQNYIVDKIVTKVKLPNNSEGTETWYQFKVPISNYDKKVGNIPDFKSIRFMRMFLTNFEDSVVLRFAKLELVRNQWRRYLYELKPGDPMPVDQSTLFNVSAVNIEENAKRTPIPYVVPPGIIRQNTLSANNTNILLNEQALSMQVCNLQDGESRALYKGTNLDLRQFSKLEMFIHAEAMNDQNSLRDGQLHAIIRLGSDFTDNYYEYEIPLTVTPWNTSDAMTIWPSVNDLNVALDKFSQLKQKRNQAGQSPLIPYSERDGANFLTIVGNPSLGELRNVMIGVINPKDDGMPKCAEIWFNEMRLTGLDEKGGWAALARMDLQLADLGTLTVSGNMHTAGFGNIDQRVNERFRDNYLQYDVATNLDLGKLLPKRTGLTIPVYAGYSQTTSTPEYDPYDLDIKLKDKLHLARTKAERDSIKRQAEDFTSITSLNFTNVRKLSMDKTKVHLWDIENFDVSYSFSQINRHNPLIENDVLTKHRGGLGYTYAAPSKFLTPFKKMVKSKSPWLGLIRDVNFNYVPSLLSFRADVTRQFGATQIRNIGGGPYKMPETYNKYFTFDRYYGLKWQLTQSINVEFNAVNNARIDEPDGRITGEKRDTVRRNFFKGGRTTNYFHSATLTYTLPTSKLPLVDWTNINLSYGTDYRWIGASRLALYLGNAIENTQQKTLTSELKFTELYNKSKFLRKVLGTSNYTTSQVPPGMNSNDFGKSTNVKVESNNGDVPKIWKIVLTPLLSLKRVTVNYSENSGTRLPGYIDSAKVLGQNWASMAPGFNFLFGYQPDKRWLDKFAQKGLITPDTTFNLQFQQQFTQRLEIQANFELLRDFKVDLNLVKSFTKSHGELYKNSGDSGFTHLNPYDAGGFEVTFIAIKTVFDKIDAEQGMSKTFKNFEAYRQVISDRLARENPYNSDPGVPTQNPKDPTYKYGYSRYAQDVLIPAFLAAYTGKDPEKIGLLKNNNSSIRSNPFANIWPRPNWRVTYTGLSRLAPFRNFLTNFTISHGYIGNLMMSSYNTNLAFEDPRLAGYPAFVDTVSGNYVPYFMVPNLTMGERFEPLLGINLTFTNTLDVKLEYKKSRTLSLSLIDYQLSEIRSSEIAVGAGYRLRGFKLPFSIGKDGGKKMMNDLNIRLDMSFRDDKTVNNKLDADIVIPTSGQKVIGIMPTIDYVVNNRVNLRFFYERKQSIPVISTSYPITTTRGGLTFRYMLAQ
ncbi:cell surface protein SprA [Chitinophaga skermanii]|uniref:Cell surface protein SprA n=1 Tax=Chitinophaga skermanii TaxID=331697 RepID=A0A327Q9F4_9BACT|nr:cell surface protein SprA [Chitinophaga skermanii]RAI98436.1 cell surface protein SprA [Chitinophaga skermanii]